MNARENLDLIADRIRNKSSRDGDRENTDFDIKNLVQTARRHSPYLASLIDKWPDVLEQLQVLSPESLLDQYLKDLYSITDYENLKSKLRVVKQKVHLLTALCDLGRAWTWEEVTEALSILADTAMSCLINVVAKDMGFQPDPQRGPVPGLFVLALGKYGARELNYSSDIDLIVFYDPDHVQLPDMNKAERLLIRFIRNLMRGFDDITHDGYVFRTDLRLRPDPRSNSVAVSTLTAERYYETLGQNWERAAMIKARFCGGDHQAAEDFIKTILTPFIWRRSLDYAAIADIHSIKRQIQGSAKPEDVIAIGHDLKLGIGGIREIEFYAQVQQLILGGRHKTLRCPRTVDALRQLAENDYVDPKISQEMIRDYALLRDLEHRIQMFADEQTHNWPTDEDHRTHLMSLYGGDSLSQFEENLTNVFRRVHKTYSELFPGEEDLSTPMGSLVFTGVEPEPITLETLNAYGFTRGAQVWRQMSEWLGGRIRATKTPRARELLTRLAPRIIEYCGTTHDPDSTFFTFANFVSDLNAGVTLFSMFVNKPEALQALIEMLSLAPPLAKMLSDQPSLIDAMIEPDFLIRKTSRSDNGYIELISADDDFETALNIVRRAVHEDQFSLTAGLLKLQSLDEAGMRFTDIAQAAINALVPCAVKETERLYGPLQGEFALLAFGKLGGREMSHRSDLDIVLVYEHEKTSSEPSNRQVDRFNKLTRRIVTALSTHTEAGGLFEVDMALRPSGRSGPLAVDFNVFEKYYREDAWTWEYMALSRARVVSGSSPNFIRRLQKSVDELIHLKDFRGHLEKDIADMHERLARDKPSKGFWDIKGKPGGLRDIEFIAQYFVLKNKVFLADPSTITMLQAACKDRFMDKNDADNLIQICTDYQLLTQLLKLAAADTYASDQFSDSFKLLLSSATNAKSFSDLETNLECAAREVSTIFTKTIRSTS